ncbi:hypothetical protein PoB_007565800 [Plakobranchus ocellatus]|uniref:Uncharacterized protein n=1 Tax=Plakobranchus ocellatus TaxID=259542 RepID=A0AAV4DXS0_9GAST|nr:hypothetical protein PoB_007565800 [Plakobranchus ocellatus]
MKEFEEGLINIIESVKFKHVRNSFQSKLKADINKIKQDKQLYIPTDKTNNYYKLNDTQYENLLNKCVIKEYRKTGAQATHEVAIEDKNIAERLDLTDRIETTAKREAFITLKDHKSNFQNKPTCRLINPCKPELGKVSKQKISHVINEVKA